MSSRSQRSAPPEYECRTREIARSASKSSRASSTAVPIGRIMAHPPGHGNSCCLSQRQGGRAAQTGASARAPHVRVVRMSAPSLDGVQLRSGPDHVADVTIALYEWRGDVWGVLGGAGHRPGYLAGTRSGDEVVVALATLDEAGRARAVEAHGVV